MNIIKETLSEQIYRVLRDEILYGRIPCGSKLTLKNLKEQFNVSSTPIREALTRLVEDGLVSYVANTGVSVIQISEDDLREIYTFMGDLDSLAIQYAVHSSEIALLKEALSENIALSRKAVNDSKEWIPLSDEFHLLFYRFCGNSRLVSSADRMRSQLSIAAYSYEEDADVRNRIFSEHEEILQEFLRDHYDEAARKMRIHLEHSLQYALQKGEEND